MKILIIEDEPLVARDLQGLIQKLEPAVELFGPLSSVQASRQWFSDHTAPDLVLSDIQLSDGTSFEIFENLTVRCSIIFTTAYDAYAIRAFKLNSIDYLLKPIDETELNRALKKYKELTTGAPLGEQLKAMLDQPVNVEKKFKERFLSVHRNALVPVKAEEIAFFQKEELIFLHTMAGEKLISEISTLDEIESLVNPDDFFRVNRQYLVHIQTVASIRATQKGLTIYLKAPFSLELDISREKAAEFKRWMES